MTLRTFDVNIIVPAERTNLVTNPSFEVATTGYAVIGSAIARVTTQSRRGIASLEITPDANQIAGANRATALTTGITYSFSVDILDVVGQTFYLQVDDNVATTYTSATWTGTGYWKRKYLTFTTASSTTFNVYVLRASTNSTTKFYTDGWQIEVGAVSTYLDGDMTGFIVGSTDYRWNGTPHASTSWRSGQTRSGGTYVSIATYAKIMTILGLGMNSIANISVPSTMGGSFYQNTVAQDRPFSIMANVTSGVASGDISGTMIKRKALMNALSPNLTKYKQPLILECTELDSASSPVSETLEIKCVYEGGLEGDYKPGFAFNDPVALNFRTYVPYLTQQGEHGTTLGFQQDVTDADYILQRSTSGAWTAMAGGGTGTVSALARGLDGSIYVGGNFTNLGDANGDYISKWTGSAWSSLSTGTNGYVGALAVASDGTLYVGGSFTNLGDANGDGIVKWTGSAWVSLGTGISGGSAIVRAIVIAPNGDVYIAGGFSLAGGVANTVNIAKWDGSVWTPLATGTNAEVYCLAIAPDGTLYAGGNFTDLGGATGDLIAKWNGTAWSVMGSGANGGIVYSIAIGPDGSVYASGAATSFGGVTNTAYIAKWNGTAWSSINAGMNATCYYLTFDYKGTLYASGSFTSVTGLSVLPDNIATYNGTTWMPLDVNFPGATTVWTILVDKITDIMYIGYADSGTAVSAVVTVPNAGTTAYPRIKFTGPGTTYQLKNYTTGKSIFFNLTLLAGETAVLDLDPKKVSFISSFRGNIMNAILPGSDLTFELLPGVNNVSAFMYGGTTAATTIYMYYRDQYESIDQAVR